MNITIDQAIKSIETHMEFHKIGEYPHVMIGEALNMAISALRAQQIPLDRSRWEECADCWLWERRSFFCPNCGRPLTEEAWGKWENMKRKLEA